MTNVVAFSGGKRCRDCDEQINPRRLAVMPSADLCAKCQEDRDMTLRKVVDQMNCRGRESVKAKNARATIEW